MKDYATKREEKEKSKKIAIARKICLFLIESCVDEQS